MIGKIAAIGLLLLVGVAAYIWFTGPSLLVVTNGRAAPIAVKVSSENSERTIPLGQGDLGGGSFGLFWYTPKGEANFVVECEDDTGRRAIFRTGYLSGGEVSLVRMRLDGCEGGLNLHTIFSFQS